MNHWLVLSQGGACKYCCGDSGSGTTLQGGHSARGPAFGEIHGGKRT